MLILGKGKDLTATQSEALDHLSRGQRTARMEKQGQSKRSPQVMLEMEHRKNSEE